VHLGHVSEPFKRRMFSWPSNERFYLLGEDENGEIFFDFKRDPPKKENVVSCQLASAPVCLAVERVFFVRRIFWRLECMHVSGWSHHRG